MAYYDKKLGVWLPKTAKEEKPILEKPKKKKKKIPEPPIQEPPEVVYTPPEPPKEEVMEKEMEKSQLLKEIVEIQKEEPIIEVPIELTPEEKIAIRRQALEAKIAELEPYHHEVDEDEIDWWVCNTCKKAYNSETVQKRHQTLKHK